MDRENVQAIMVEFVEFLTQGCRREMSRNLGKLGHRVGKRSFNQESIEVRIACLPLSKTHRFQPYQN